MTDTAPTPATSPVAAKDFNPAWTIERLEKLRATLIERHPEAAEDAELTALFEGVRNELGMIVTAPPAPPANLFGGHTREELQAAFALVRPAVNWKYPIDAVLSEPIDDNLIADAVLFFTGSPVVFSELPGNRVRVTAVGYYASIGS